MVAIFSRERLSGWLATSGREMNLKRNVSRLHDFRGSNAIPLMKGSRFQHFWRVSQIESTLQVDGVIKR